MRSFLTRIAKGAYKSDIEKEHKALLDELLREGIVKEIGEKVQLDSKYRAGVVDLLPSGTAFLELIGAKGRDLLIESQNINGAKNGDYVIVKRVFGKPGRPSARVVKVVQPAFVYAVGYIKNTESGLQPFHIKTDLPMELKSSIEGLSEYTVFQADNRICFSWQDRHLPKIFHQNLLSFQEGLWFLHHDFF